MPIVGWAKLTKRGEPTSQDQDSWWRARRKRLCRSYDSSPLFYNAECTIVPAPAHKIIGPKRDWLGAPRWASVTRAFAVLSSRDETAARE